MHTLMPADRHSATASGTLGRSGSARPTRPRNSNAKSCCESGQIVPAKEARATPSTRKPFGGHGVDGRAQRGAILGAEVTKIGDGLGCALGRDDELLLAIRGLPDLRHGEEIGAKPVSVYELPFGAMQMFGLGQTRSPEIMERLLHRVEGFWRAGENAELDKVMEARPASSRRSRRAAETLSPSFSRNSAMDIRFSVRVPVLSVHNTVAEPSVSIAAARRVRTRAREIRQAPIAMNTVSTTGNSSGSIDMPSAMPASTASSHPPRKAP